MKKFIFIFVCLVSCCLVCACSSEEGAASFTTQATTQIETQATQPEQTLPVTTGPLHTEPATTEPQQTDPMLTESQQTDPTLTEPQQTQPTETTFSCDEWVPGPNETPDRG